MEAGSGGEWTVRKLSVSMREMANVSFTEASAVERD